ncbi:MAG: hypothetical protein KF746_09955 [Chitinophagaceae bacterium]|nr:hypothetical protein [Chitinophagaceae bacterium]
MRRLLTILFFLITVSANSQHSSFRENFAQPPIEYGPWTWWHWINGNVSKKGITRDLEAMHEVGIAGLVCFNGSAGIPKGHLQYASDEWFAYNKYAMSEAQRLGLKMMLHNAPGYSVTGAPWISPENSMQQVVWSETFVTNQSGAIKLLRPFAKLGYYKDIAVIAYPALEGEEKPMAAYLDKIKVNGTDTAKENLFNYDYEHGVNVTIPAGKEHGELLLEFKEPFEASSIVIRREHTGPPNHPYDGPRDNPPSYQLEYANDGITYIPLACINMPALRELNVPSSQNFQTVKAKYFRLLTNKNSRITELNLYAAPRLENWESKANYIVNANRVADFTEKNIPAAFVINPEEVIDITQFLQADGTLNWTVPKGNWTILRMGHTTTGEENAAAPDGAKGLECDKLNKRGVNAHYNGFLKKLFEETKEFRGNTFQGLIVDSWEAGTQNWTRGFEKEFQTRTQYDIIPYLAAFTGRIVSSTVATEKFLADIRQTQATLLAENYYGALRTICHENNLLLLVEPYGDGPFNSLEVAKFIDIPSGEFWAHALYGGTHTNNQSGYIARTNSRKIAAAEAFTAMPDLSKFTGYPAAMKPEGDWMYTNGINRFMFHTFAHQPHPTAKPGMTLGPFGTHMNRNQTWWQQSKNYMDYLRRCQFMLQQGQFVSSSSPWVPVGSATDATQKKDDFTFVTLDKNPIINYIHRKQDNVDYYFVANNKRQPQKILAIADVQGKQPELWYPETGKQIPVYNYKTENGKTLLPINLNASEAVFVVFNGDPKQQPVWDEKDDLRNIKIKHRTYNEVNNSFTTSVWLRPDVVAVNGRSYVIYPQSGEILYGNGHATIGLSVGQNGVKFFEQAGARAEQVLFAEVKIEGWSLVNVVYKEGVPVIYINGKKVKEGTKSKYIVHANDIELAPKEPMITIFQGNYHTPEIASGALAETAITKMFQEGVPQHEQLFINNKPLSVIKTIPVNNSWKVRLNDSAGFKKQFNTKELRSLHLHSDKDIKYFSGTATYGSTFALADKGANQLLLDLGEVAFFANVFINGKKLPLLWKAPYIADVTDFVQNGKNEITVHVTNLWTNRLIGDEQLPQENTYDKWGEISKLPDWYINNQPKTGKRKTFVAWKQYDRNGPLTESGLIGPVKILVVEKPK